MRSRSLALLCCLAVIRVTNAQDKTYQAGTPAIASPAPRLKPLRSSLLSQKGLLALKPLGPPWLDGSSQSRVSSSPGTRATSQLSSESRCLAVVPRQAILWIPCFAGSDCKSLTDDWTNLVLPSSVCPFSFTFKLSRSAKSADNLRPLYSAAPTVLVLGPAMNWSPPGSCSRHTLLYLYALAATSHSCGATPLPHTRLRNTAASLSSEAVKTFCTHDMVHAP